MIAITCPKCGAENASNAMNCKQCRINLRFALEHPEEIEAIKKRDLIEAYRQDDQELLSTPVDFKLHDDEIMYPRPPWFDNGEDIVVNEIIAPDVIGQPFEIYCYEPVSGYGFMQFEQESIRIKYPIGFPSYRGGYKGNSYSIRTDEFDLIYGLAQTIRYLFKRKKGESWLEIPYRSIQDLSLSGCTVELSHSEFKPRYFKIRVAALDGERLYRELYLHYPTAISRWKGTLQNMFGPAMEVQVMHETISPSVEGQLRGKISSQVYLVPFIAGGLASFVGIFLLLLIFGNSTWDIPASIRVEFLACGLFELIGSALGAIAGTYTGNKQVSTVKNALVGGLGGAFAGMCLVCYCAMGMILNYLYKMRA